MTTDPQHELLDIVDDNNQVIGSATRGEIHARGLKHRACHILLLNSQNEIYVQQRSLGKDSGAGLWDSSAAGHVDAEESYDDCAQRELQEELGLTVTVDQLELLFTLPATALTGMEFAQVYKLISDQQPQPDEVEIADGCWCEPSRLRLWMNTSPADFTQVFRHICERLALC